MTTTSLDAKSSNNAGGEPAICLGEGRCACAGMMMHVESSSRQQSGASPRMTGADRKLAAARLNNIGAALLEHARDEGVEEDVQQQHAAAAATADRQQQGTAAAADGEACATAPASAPDLTDRSIEIFRDAVEILTARKDGQHGGFAFELAKAEACLARADESKKASLKRSKTKNGRGRGSSTSDVDESESESESVPVLSSSSWEDNSFRYASSVEVGLPADYSRSGLLDHRRGRGGGGANDKEVAIGNQGLLVVLLYNLALAHTIAGFAQNRQTLIDKATSLYKMTENLLLRLASEDPTALRGVDVTYLARSVVNNMGLILFEWGRPDDGREYFEGLTSICFDDDDEDEDEHRTDYEQAPARGRRRRRKSGGKRRDWKAFEINALIARGLNASPAA